MSYSPMELANAFIKAGELDDALDALNDYLTDNPDDDDVRRLRVQVLMRLDAPEHLLGALDDLDALYEPAPIDAYTRSVVLEKQGKLEDALAAAYDAAKDADTVRGARATGRVLELLRKNGELEAALNLALDQNWVQLAADLATELNEPERALPYYNEALARAEDLDSITSPGIAANIKARILLKRAGVHMALAHNDQADDDYVAAAAVIPDDPMIPFNRAVLAARRGDEAAARDLLKTAHDSANETLRTKMFTEMGANFTLKALWLAITRK